MAWRGSCTYSCGRRPLRDFKATALTRVEQQATQQSMLPLLACCFLLTQVPKAEAVRSLTVCRVLVIPRRCVIVGRGDMCVACRRVWLVPYETAAQLTTTGSFFVQPLVHDNETRLCCCHCCVVCVAHHCCWRPLLPTPQHLQLCGARLPPECKAGAGEPQAQGSRGGFGRV